MKLTDALFQLQCLKDNAEYQLSGNQKEDSIWEKDIEVCTEAKKILKALKKRGITDTAAAVEWIEGGR